MFRTWRTLIAEALVRSGYIGRGQTANENLFKEGETSLSFLLDKLDGSGVMLPLFSVLTFNTIANQAMYLLVSPCNVRPPPFAVISVAAVPSSGTPSTIFLSAIVTVCDWMMVVPP